MPYHSYQDLVVDPETDSVADPETDQAVVPETDQAADLEIGLAVVLEIGLAAGQGTDLVVDLGIADHSTDQNCILLYCCMKFKIIEKVLHFSQLH